MEQTERQNGKPESGGVTLLQTTWSVLASFFGVQSTRNWQRDFSHGNPWAFVLIGLLATTAFVLVLLGLVRLMLHNAGM